MNLLHANDRAGEYPPSYYAATRAAFAAQPYTVGQAVQLHWTPEQAHPLSPQAVPVLPLAVQRQLHQQHHLSA